MVTIKISTPAVIGAGIAQEQDARHKNQNHYFTPPRNNRDFASAPHISSSFELGFPNEVAQEELLRDPASAGQG
jgi:hypothetical protein